MAQDENVALEGYAIVEMMGHRTLVGRVSEVRLAGVAMLAVRRPGREGDGAVQIVRPESLYCLTPIAEETARALAGQCWDTAPLLGLCPAASAQQRQERENRYALDEQVRAAGAEADEELPF